LAKRFLVIILLSFLTYLNIHAEDSTQDIKEEAKLITADASADVNPRRRSPAIVDIDYVPPKEKLKRPSVFFQAGGSLDFYSRALLAANGADTYFKTAGSGFEFVPNDKWIIGGMAKIWGKVLFQENGFFKFGGAAALDWRNGSLAPFFNIDELFLNWNYPLGKVVIGRTNFTMKDSMIFSGPLDAVELTINVPFLNFKTFVGFSGLLGLFSPYFNPYSITQYDRSFFNQTNILNSTFTIQINDTQSRRIFFSTDFDINLAAQHINPYFLMQYDLSSIFGNTGYAVSTFHLGLNLEGRIVENLYYKLDLAGMFGTNQNIATTQLLPIIACGFVSQLRYTATAFMNSTFILGYALGTGNQDSSSFWNDSNGTSQATLNKFYYYGKFDGGFALNPVLSNIQSASFRYSFSPAFKNSKFRCSLYAAFYQTFKLYPEACISDDAATQNSYIVGSEIDAGTLFNFGRNVSLGFDFGIFIPETAYLITTPRLKGGISLNINF
jgi:hypothetical protein